MIEEHASVVLTEPLPSAGLGPVHNQLILVPSGFLQEARIDAKDAAQ